MITCGKGGDLLTDFSLIGSMFSCHDSIDLVTTVTGDLALTKDETENNRQRLLMWLATPKGERLDPSIGCCLHDYFHAKMTGAIYRQLELDIESDLKSVFPEMTISDIAVENISDISSGNRIVQVGVTLGDDSIKFLSDFDSASSLNEKINSLLYYGGYK